MKKGKQCPGCGMINVQGAYQCGSCGTNLEEIKAAIMGAQVTKATVDNADNTRELVALMHRQMTKDDD